MRRSLLSSFYYWQSNRSCSCDPMLGVWISQHTPSIGSQEEQLLHYTPNKGSTKPFKYIHTIPRLHQKTTTTLWSQLSQMLWKYLWRWFMWKQPCILTKYWGTGKQVYSFIIKLLLKILINSIDLEDHIMWYKILHKTLNEKNNNNKNTLEVLVNF